MYPVQVRMIQEMKSGMHKGMTLGHYTGFWCEKDAIAWAKSVSESPRTDYRVISMVNIKTDKVVFEIV